jgi:hypothetical protein
LTPQAESCDSSALFTVAHAELLMWKPPQERSSHIRQL